MKKLSILVAAAAMSASVFADVTPTPSRVMFSSEGPDKYADGTTVLDGEVYALVWTPNAAFGGLNADGTPIVAGDRLVGLSPNAKDGKCGIVFYMLDGEDAKITGGNFFVYLLDTRVTTADAEGNVTTTVGGLTADGKLASVNCYDNLVATSRGTATALEEGAVTGEGAVASAVPADVKNPRITAIQVVGAKVVVKVADTVPFLQYGVTAGKTPSKLDQKDLIPGMNGVAEGEITLIVSDPQENRFFKVTRK